MADTLPETLSDERYRAVMYEETKNTTVLYSIHLVRDPAKRCVCLV
jgi:hypothetical protein